jgi:hypothetical protein
MEMATPRWIAFDGTNAPSLKKPLSSGALASACATAFNCTTPMRSRSVTGRCAFCCASHAAARAIGIVSER